MFMLEYELFKESDEEVIYKYYPEGKKQAGLVSVSKSTGECKINELSLDDRHQRYALKLFKKLKEYASNNSFNLKGMIAWY